MLSSTLRCVYEPSQPQTLFYYMLLYGGNPFNHIFCHNLDVPWVFLRISFLYSVLLI